jgi:hypothetical protein
LAAPADCRIARAVSSSCLARKDRTPGGWSRGLAASGGAGVPRKGRQLKADLRRAGFELERQKGSHETWQHTRYPGITVNLALGDGDDARYYQEDDVRNAISRVRAKEQEEP